jgi:hypothetical protein
MMRSTQYWQQVMSKTPSLQWVQNFCNLDVNVRGLPFPNWQSFDFVRQFDREHFISLAQQYFIHSVTGEPISLPTSHDQLLIRLQRYLARKTQEVIAETEATEFLQEADIKLHLETLWFRANELQWQFFIKGNKEKTNSTKEKIKSWLYRELDLNPRYYRMISLLVFRPGDWSAMDTDRTVVLSYSPLDKLAKKGMVLELEQSSSPQARGQVLQRGLFGLIFDIDVLLTNGYPEELVVATAGDDKIGYLSASHLYDELIDGSARLTDSENDTIFYQYRPITSRQPYQFSLLAYHQLVASMIDDPELVINDPSSHYQHYLVEELVNHSVSWIDDRESVDFTPDFFQEIQLKLVSANDHWGGEIHRFEVALPEQKIQKFRVSYDHAVGAPKIQRHF